MVKMAMDAFLNSNNYHKRYDSCPYMFVQGRYRRVLFMGLSKLWLPGSTLLKSHNLKFTNNS